MRGDRGGKERRALFFHVFSLPLPSFPTWFSLTRRPPSATSPHVFFIRLCPPVLPLCPPPAPLRPSCEFWGYLPWWRMMMIHEGDREGKRRMIPFSYILASSSSISYALPF